MKGEIWSANGSSCPQATNNTSENLAFQAFRLLLLIDFILKEKKHVWGAITSFCTCL